MSQIALSLALQIPAQKGACAVKQSFGLASIGPTTLSSCGVLMRTVFSIKFALHRLGDQAALPYTTLYVHY